LDFLLLRFGLSLASTEMESAPGGLGQLKLLADDYSDKSIDPEDIREDLKTELLAVHVALKKLDKDIDFLDVIRPLIAEQGPAVQHITRLSKQIDRLNKFREQFQRDKDMLLASAPSLRVPAPSVHRTTLVSPLRCRHWKCQVPTPLPSYPAFKTWQFWKKSIVASFLASSKAAQPRRTLVADTGLKSGMGFSLSIRRDWNPRRGSALT
jgi:hypothetical protein